MAASQGLRPPRRNNPFTEFASPEMRAGVACALVTGFRRYLPFGLFALTAISPLHGHQEWHNLHITYSAKSSFTYPFDGRSPKIGAALLNHYDVTAAETTFAFSVNGQRPAAPSFTTFPDGGNIVVAAQNFGFASALTTGIYDGHAGPAPAVGETREFSFQFQFALAPGVPPPRTLATAPGNPDPGNTDPPGTQTARVRFTNLGDNPTLTGPLVISGNVRLHSLVNCTGKPSLDPSHSQHPRHSARARRSVDPVFKLVSRDAHSVRDGRIHRVFPSPPRARRLARVLQRRGLRVARRARRLH